MGSSSEQTFSSQYKSQTTNYSYGSNENIENNKTMIKNIKKNYNNAYEWFINILLKL